MKLLLTRSPIGLCLLIICFQVMLAAAETVQINDANLRRQLELALNKEAGQPISAE